MASIPTTLVSGTLLYVKNTEDLILSIYLATLSTVKSKVELIYFVKPSV